MLMLGLALFVVDPLKYRLLEAVTAGRSLFPAALSGASELAPRWVPLGLLSGGLILLLVAREVRAASLSRALTAAPTPAFLLMATVLLLWFAQAYLYPGLLLGGDTGSHLVRLVHFGRGLQEGKLLFWNNDFYMGAPFLQFYAPLFFWLGGAFYAVTGSAEWAPKLFLLVLQLLGAGFFYGFLRTAGPGRLAALLGALAYSGAWAHGHLLLYKGVLPLALIFTLLPAAFLAAERLLKGRHNLGAAWVGLALATAGLLATHQPHGLFAGVYLAAYVGLRSLTCARPFRLLLLVGTSGLAGILVALFTIVPFLAEQHWVMAEPGSAFFVLRWPDLSYLKHLLLWANGATTYASESAAYLGVSVVALGVAAVIPLRDPKRAPVTGWALIICSGLLLSLVWRGALVRDIAFTLFFAAALAAAGAQRLLERFPTHRHLPAVILIALLLDLGSTAIQPVVRADKNYLLAAGEYLAMASPAQRVVIANNRAAGDNKGRIELDMGPTALPLQYAPVQTVSGPHNHAATPVHNYAATAVMRAERDLVDQGTLSAGSESLLAMLNVGRIINDTGRSLGFDASVPGATDEPPLGRVIHIAAAAPVVFAPTLAPIDLPPAIERPLVWHESFRDWTDPQAQRMSAFLDRVLQTMQYQPAQRVAARILMPTLPAGDGLTTPGEEAQTAVSVKRYTVSADRVDLMVAVSAPGFLQLSHPWYPTLQVLHNGKHIAPLRGVLNLIVVPALAGDNEYRLSPARSSLRRAVGTFSAIVLVSVLVTPLLAAGWVRRMAP